MPRPAFLKTLPASATKAYDFIRSGVRQGISARAMESIIRREITAISRTTINQVVRGIKGNLTTVADLRFLKKGARPDPRRIQFAKSDILTEYSFTLEVNATNIDTGLRETRHMQVVTDELLSRAELDDIAQHVIDADPNRYRYKDVEFVVVDAVQRA